jgi:hypothetical protein
VGPRARTRTERTDAHTRLLDSTVGQTFVAIVVFVMSIWILGPNMPASPLRDTVEVVWSPAIDAGFDQNWSVFSPNPRDQTIEVVAVLEYDDGTSVEWTVPDFDPTIGALRSYRWRKWQERVRLDSYESYWEPSAAWIADQNRIDGQRPNTVRLLRRWTVLEPLTEDGILTNIEEQFEFYEWTR